MRANVMELIALLVVSLAACTGDPRIASGDAEVKVTVDYEAPPAWMDMPISIGGYAYFVEIVGPRLAGGEVTAGAFTTTLPPGHYRIEVVTRPQSDAVAIDVVTGQTNRELGRVTARCSAEVDLNAEGIAIVQYTAVGGDVCRLVVKN